MILIILKIFLSSLVDKVITGAFVGAVITGIAGSALGLPACVIISVKAHFSDHTKLRDTSQLMKYMSKDLQKLLEYFNCTTVLRFF